MALPQRNSAQWVALRLLGFLGVTSLAEQPPSTDASATSQTYVTPGLLDDMAGLITAALQQIALDGPAVLSETPTGGAVFAPTAITLNVTATVYGNAVRLPIGTRTVLGPVILGGHGELAPAASKEEFDRVSGASLHSGWGGLRQGWPRCYFVETGYDETLSYLTQTLRIAPTSMGPLPLSFRVKMDPPTISTDDLGDDDNDPAVMFRAWPGNTRRACCCRTASSF